MEHEQAVQNLAVESYLLGEMNAEQQEDFESHYFECVVCADDLRAATQFIGDAKDILASESTRRMPVPSASEQRSGSRWIHWLTPQFAAAAIALLVVVAGIESLTIPSLERRLADAGAPKIVNPTYLRPQTRGAPATLQTASGEPAVFIFDLPESVPSALQYVLKSADGRTIFRTSGRAPGRSEPATLSIPKLELPDGSYTLIVEAVAANDQEGESLGSYPFEIKRQF